MARLSSPLLYVALCSIAVAFLATSISAAPLDLRTVRRATGSSSEEALIPLIPAMRLLQRLRQCDLAAALNVSSSNLEDSTFFALLVQATCNSHQVLATISSAIERLSTPSNYSLTLGLMKDIANGTVMDSVDLLRNTHADVSTGDFPIAEESSSEEILEKVGVICSKFDSYQRVNATLTQIVASRDNAGLVMSGDAQAWLENKDLQLPACTA